MPATAPQRLGFRGTKQVAEFFGISERKVRDLAATGGWPTYCIGGRRLFDLDELVQLVKGERREGPRCD
jgi:excisionase family DNA binding protein